MNRLQFIGYLLFLLAFARTADAQWKVVGMFPDPIDAGYFFDADHGMIGSGIRETFVGSAKIYTTSNGGTTWRTSTVPFTSDAAVTNISMIDQLTGYASIYSNGLYQSSLWKTTDGGASWIDVSPTLGNFATCVFANPSVIVLTQWQAEGIVATNGGAFKSTFPYDLQSGERGSTGVDFSDAMHGVVTMGPNAFPSSYYTNDGGVSWSTCYDLPESWSVYAVKGTTTFFSAGEGSGGGQKNIYQSTDGGASWRVIYTFTDPLFTFTGHITGGGNTLYAQTDVGYASGLVRSDDLGRTWKFVGGPSSSRDTRFVVTGCAGSTVYAFDDQGNVFKTVTGGDGTLSGGSSPYVTVGSIPSVKAGEYTAAKIMLSSLPAKTSVSSVSLHLAFNGDVLTPKGLETMGTLSDQATSATWTPDGNNGVTVQIALPTPLSDTSDLTKPLIYIDFLATLSDSLHTDVTLDQFSINTTTPLGLCTPPFADFTLKTTCGDSTITAVMNKRPLLDLLSIIPNPSHGGTVTIEYSLREAASVSIAMYDANGEQVQVAVGAAEGKIGLNTLTVPTSRLHTGTYLIQLISHTSTGSERIVTGKLIHVR